MNFMSKLLYIVKERMYVVSEFLGEARMADPKEIAEVKFFSFDQLPEELWPGHRNPLVKADTGVVLFLGPSALNIFPNSLKSLKLLRAHQLPISFLLTARLESEAFTLPLTIRFSSSMT
jgi:hypothetical protein